MANEKKSFLTVKNLTVEYQSQGAVVHAVNGVSFEIGEGETLGLVGETGAGKTSTAKAILRVLPDVGAKIREGEVLLDGEDLLKLSERKMQHIRGNKISMIFQDPMSALNPVQTIVEQVAEPIRFHNKISRAEATARAIKMLETVGITPDRVREYPHQFSGGMRQRAVIAIALACEPKLLLADEPTTALDVTIQAQVLDLISDLRKQFHTAMLLITHDLGVVGEICDKVAVIYAGEIVECGDKIAIYDHPAHPYTEGLFASLPDLKKDVNRLTPIEGLPPNPTDLPGGCMFHPRCPYATEECSKTRVELTQVGPEHFSRCLKNDRKGR